MSVKLQGLERPTDEDVDEELAAERASLELRYTFTARILYRPPTPQRVDRYLERLREWMVEHRKVAIMRSHTFDVELMLANEGTGNAADIEIDLTFPASIALGERRRFPEVKERPPPPEPEEVGIAAAMKSATIPAFRPIPRPDLVSLANRFTLREGERLVFDKKDEHRVRILVDGAKHHSSILLPPFQAWFPTGRVLTGFQIGYRIHAASTPEIKEGHLNVKVEVTEGRARLLRGAFDSPEDDEGRDDAPDSEPEWADDE